MPSQFIFGIHAVTGSLKRQRASVKELHFDPTRQDARMQAVLALAASVGVRAREANAAQLDAWVGAHARHQGVVARVERAALGNSLDDLLDALDAKGEAPLVLVLDGVTDPHNLGACLRAADGAGAHAVVAPKDRSVGLSAVAIKVASGAADTVPFISVTNLARALREMQERQIRVIGTAGEAEMSIYEPGLHESIALVMGAEGEGLRRLTRDTCDELRKIPLAGLVESMNVAVSAGVCLFEARRQRLYPPR